jgi:arginyl-tRNA synthetase
LNLKDVAESEGGEESKDAPKK